MSLNKTNLQSNIKTWMQTARSSQSTAGADFESLYHTYILDAVDISGDSVNSVITGSIQTAFTILTLSETYATAAQKIETGFINYWTSATFKILHPATGISAETSAIVTSPPVAGIFATALTSIFSNLSLSIDDRSNQMATAIDTMTKTVIVSCIGPSTVAPFPVITVLGNIS